MVAPRFEEIDSELGLLSEFRDKPAGKLRLTAGEHAAITILQPVLATLLPDNPDLSIEVIVDYGLTDIVAEGYDAGVRLGQQVAKDMIAMRIGPDMRMAVVGSPAYFARHPQPVIPRDLMQHNCINIRMPTYGGIFPGNSRRTERNSRYELRANWCSTTSPCAWGSPPGVRFGLHGRRPSAGACS